MALITRLLSPESYHGFMSDDFLFALQDTWGFEQSPEEEAGGAAERLADAVTAWLSGDPCHQLEVHLEKVEHDLVAVPDRPERRMLETAVTLLRQAYASDRPSESWHLADMVRQVAGLIAA